MAKKKIEPEVGARLTFLRAEEYTDEEIRRISAWLKSEICLLKKERKNMAKRYTSSFFVYREK